MDEGTELDTCDKPDCHRCNFATAQRRLLRSISAKLDKTSSNVETISTKLFGARDSDDENETGRFRAVERSTREAHAKIEGVAHNSYEDLQAVKRELRREFQELKSATEAEFKTTNAKVDAIKVKFAYYSGVGVGIGAVVTFAAEFAFKMIFKN